MSGKVMQSAAQLARLVVEMKHKTKSGQLWLGQERRQATMLAGPTDGWRADYRETTQHSIRQKEAQILLLILVLMWEFLQ